MSIELLDTLHTKGLVAAHAHFDTLVACMHSMLPEGVKDTIPKTLDEVAGLFSASTKEFYLTILPNTLGYESLSVVFEYKELADPCNRVNLMWAWAFKKYCVMIGGYTMLSIPKEYTANCIEDALVLSKKIASYREQQVREQQALEMPLIPETEPTTRPN